MTQKISQQIINFYSPYRNTLSEWKKTTISNRKFEIYKQYQVIDKIGQGAYGIVIAAKDHQNLSQLVAIKKIQKVFEHRIFAKRALRELKQLRLLNHQNIMKIQTIILPKSRQQFQDIYLISELMDTDLREILVSQQELKQEHIKFFLYQIIRGLKYIHSAKIIHRDLKPRNLLVNSNCDLKICDFGLARALNKDYASQMTDYVCTRWYRAPELLMGSNNYTASVDMWSVGCIFAEMLQRKPFLKGTDTKNQLQLILDYVTIPNFDNLGLTDEGKQLLKVLYGKRKPKKLSQKFQKASPEAIDLLKKLLTFQPSKRISAEEALKHPFLADYHLQDDQPTRQQVDPLEFQFQNHVLTTQQIKDLIYEEILLQNHGNFRQQYEEKIKNRQSVISHVLNNSNKTNFDSESDNDD